MSDEREISNEIAIDADADTVWRAISEGEELKRWFPPDARVTPGVGGSVWLSWGEGADWEAPIELWEPGKRIRTVDPAPSKLAVDYIIEARGGETVLRIVHSGFAADAWQDELDTMNNGWRAFLANLRHYLEQHRGEPRTLAAFRHPVVELEREEAFQRILGVFGFPKGAEYRSGARYDVTTVDGERLEGRVEVFERPINLSATIESLSDAFLTIEIEPGRGRCRPAAWLSLYGDAGAQAPALEARLRAMMGDAFAPESA